MLNAIPPKRHGYSLRGAARHRTAYPKFAAIATAAMFATMILVAACSKRPESSSPKYPRCTGVPGPVTFHDASGNPVKSIQVMQDTKDLDEGGVAFHAVRSYGCSSGNHAVILREDGVSNQDAGKFESVATLEFYSADGKLLWSKKLLPHEEGFPLLVSKSDTRILYQGAGTDGWALVMLTTDGKEKVFQFPHFGLRNILMSDNGRYAVIHAVGAASTSFFRFYDFESGKSHDFLSDEGFGTISNDGAAEVAVYPKPGTKERIVIHRFKFE